MGKAERSTNLSTELHKGPRIESMRQTETDTVLTLCLQATRGQQWLIFVVKLLDFWAACPYWPRTKSTWTRLSLVGCLKQLDLHSDSKLLKHYLDYLLQGILKSEKGGCPSDKIKITEHTQHLHHLVLVAVEWVTQWATTRAIICLHFDKLSIKKCAEFTMSNSCFWISLDSFHTRENWWLSDKFWSYKDLLISIIWKRFMDFCCGTHQR